MREQVKQYLRIAQRANEVDDPLGDRLGEIIVEILGITDNECEEIASVMDRMRILVGGLNAFELTTAAMVISQRLCEEAHRDELMMEIAEGSIEARMQDEAVVTVEAV